MNNKEQKLTATNVAPQVRQTDVSSIISVTANVPKEFADAVKELYKVHNCQLKKYNDYKNGWVTVEVQGGKSDIENLNNDCKQMAYRNPLLYCC